LARHGFAVLALLCLLLWLPGILTLPVLDRDESRFAQSSRQMLDSGNFVDIRFGQVPRYKKPVGIYWLQAAATWAAGPLNPDGRIHAHAWTYRLPSLLGGFLAVWLSVWCGALFSAAAGLLAGGLMLASLLLTAEAGMATTDAVLLATIIAMQGVLLRIYRAAKENTDPPSTKLVMAGWAALALGVLLKGPVAPAVALVTIIALLAWGDGAGRKLNWSFRPPADQAGGRSGIAGLFAALAAEFAERARWLSQTKPVRGVILAVIITAPWLVAITLESHGAFFRQSLGGDFAAKVAGGQEGHGAPPGYYLLLSALTFWPAILFVLPGIGLAVTRKAEPMIRFLLCWAGAWWLAVEIVPTKLPNYVLPSLPPLAILAALWLLAPREPASGWRRLLPWIAALQFTIVLAALIAAPLELPKYYALNPPDDWPLPLAASLSGVFGLAALIIFLMGRRLMAVIPAILSAAIAVLTLTVLVGPHLDQLWVSERLAALVAKDRHPNDPPPILAGYEEPSLVFALGKDVDLTDGRGAAEQGAHTGGLALVDDEERPKFLARLAELEDAATELDDLSGFNYSRGRAVHVTLYRVAPLAPVPTPEAH
jgi:4-amino-4-deoxy-L-arabinose transferase-like glycosyltransferase